jgi:SAM-dependent methyltransferase
MRPEQLQREHYAKTAGSYEEDLGRTPEHEFALYLLLGLIDCIKCESVLDVGAGTGRGLRFLMNYRPKLRVIGIEPVEELRSIALASGIPRERLVGASGYAMPFADESFDVAMEFGVLHHVKNPGAVVDELLRVARYAVFLSDTNNLGQGSLLARIIKNGFYWTSLWSLFNFVRTLGRGYVFEPNDGLWYYYTVLSHFRQLEQRCHSVHVINTRRSSRTPWFSASHAAILATKPSIVNRCPFFAHLRS